MARLLVLANEATAEKRRVYFHLVDATDGITAETGEGSGQPQVSSDGASWTNTGIGTLTHIGNGRYYADLTQALVATAGTQIETRFKSANTAECPGDSVSVVAFNPYDTVRLGLTALPNVASGNSGAIPTVGTGTAQISVSSGQVILQSGTGTGQLSFTSGILSVNTTQISGDATAADTLELFAEALDQATGQLDSGSLANGTITAASIADGAIDRATFAVDTGLQTVRSNTAAAGGATSITLDASASAVNDFYKDAWISLTGGTGSGQTRQITGYVGSTKVATVATWATNPDNTSTFAILRNNAVATTITDKTGYKLASDGLDSVATTAPSGVASNFREMLVQTWRHFFKKSTMSSTQIKTYADDGTTVVTTQTISDTGSLQTRGAAS